MIISQTSPLIFVHIPKCGGMSLFSGLAETFGPQIADLYNESDRTRGKARLKLEDQTKSVYCGHFSFGVHEWMNRKTSYVSFVRDPIDRMVSLYQFCLPTFKGKFSRYRTTPLAEIRRHLELPDFFMDFPACIQGDYSPEAFFNSPSAELDNGMVRRFSGKGLSPEPCTEADYERAIQNIEKFFSFVGITERYEESIARLGELYGLKNLREKKVNVTKPQDVVERKTVFSDELMEKIKSMNMYDIRLYDWVCQTFDRKDGFKTVRSVPVPKRRSSPSIPLWRSVGAARVRDLDILTYGQKNLKRSQLGSIKLMNARLLDDKVTVQTLYKPIGSKQKDDFELIDTVYTQKEALHLLQTLTNALKAIQKKK